LIDLCINVIQKGWNDYEFDFSGIPQHLKFKILLSLFDHSISITEEDLYAIFIDDYSLLRTNEVFTIKIF